jgi:hypothetical protein
MYYEILVNGDTLGVFGHEHVRNMSVSVSVVEDRQDIFASAVCEEAEEWWFYDWLQHPIGATDVVEIRRVSSGPSRDPRRKRRMERPSAKTDSAPPNKSLERTREG